MAEIRVPTLQDLHKSYGPMTNQEACLLQAVYRDALRAVLERITFSRRIIRETISSEDGRLMALGGACCDIAAEIEAALPKAEGGK